MKGTFRDLFLLETLGSWERDRSRDSLVLVGAFASLVKRPLGDAARIYWVPFQ